eukprot:400444_1
MLLSCGWALGMVEDAVKRVRLITADLKVCRGEAGSYAKNFFLDPEVRAREADVLVCTYAAEAGVSMPPKYFQAVFGMLYPGVGTWDSQFQSLNRVRENVFTMASIPEENASSVGPVRSGASVHHQISHLYCGQKPWTFAAGVQAKVQSLDLRANVWVLWQKWLEAHPQVNAICVTADGGDSEEALEIPTSEQFWDHWPSPPVANSPDALSRFVATKDCVRTKLKFARDSVSQATYDELAHPESSADGNGALSSALTQDIVSSRAGVLELRLEGYIRSSTRLHTVRNVTRLAPWLAEKSGSSLDALLARMSYGLAYLRFVERVVGDRASRQELRGTLTPFHVATSTFLAHVLKCLGCVPALSEEGGKPYFLPLGINGIVHNARGTAVLRDAIDTFPAVQLRRNDILNGKDIWAAVCSNAPLPPRTATGETRGNNLVAWVKKLLLGYGLEFLWKEAVASRPRRGGSSPPRSRRRSAPTPRGTMHCTTQGWRETLGVMQFIACSQSKPLTFSGFTEDDRNALAEVDRLIEAPVDTPDVELEPEDEPR